MRLTEASHRPCLVSSLGQTQSLWQPHQPHNEDTETVWDVARSSSNRRGGEVTQETGGIIAQPGMMGKMYMLQFIKHHMRCNYINWHCVTKCKNTYKCCWLNPGCIHSQRASVLTHKKDCWRSAARSEQTRLTSRLMMIAFINNVSVWGVELNAIFMSWGVWKAARIPLAWQWKLEKKKKKSHKLSLSDCVVWHSCIGQ